MNAILVKIFATALAFSQVATRPDAVKTHFDPATDQAEVAQILSDGCAYMRKAFDIESINLDDLISTAMDDPEAFTGDVKVLKGLSFKDLLAAYRQFCKNEKDPNTTFDMGEVIAFYNGAAADLPDHEKLKALRLPGMSVVLDDKGKSFAELFEAENRRVWVPLSDVPELVQKAFVAAEDKRFYEHKGIDERGLIRAFIDNLAQRGRPQGGSTITQQVAKMLLVGDDVTYERKIREIIVAGRLEHTLSKSQILELYLNSIYLGRAAWGIEMAARSYFGKPAKELTLAEGALLAGLTKGPNYFNPDRHPDRAKERFAYVLSRMVEDGAITGEAMKTALDSMPQLVASERVRRDTGFYFVDQVSREAASAAKIESLTKGSYTVHSTIDPELQWAAESALQEGLAHYELNTGRYRFEAPEANLSDAIRRLEAEPQTDPLNPSWRQALIAARLPLYDVHWPRAIVLEKSRAKGGAQIVKVGLTDGRTVPLTTWKASIRNALKVNDVVYVRIVEGKGRKGPHAELRMRPSVQGATVVIENKTGRVLAMVGGFSYPLSQLNRASQSQRQPGSALKPLSYLAALARGLQPNTLVLDGPITLPPITANGHVRSQDYWTPKNYDNSMSGLTTLRRGLEHSKNLVTAHLLDGGIAATPEESLDRVCALALEARLYTECVRYYPFVLGAQPVRPIDIAAFYAAVANEGARPTPHVIESIEQGGRTIYRHDSNQVSWLGSADRVAFYQLKTILRGVVERGTASALRQVAPFVGGKTGTSDDENDAWFVGFTNDITIAVWVGYDNADGKRRTLGPGQTGARVAIPVFAPILQAAWSEGRPRAPLAPPSAEVKRHIAVLPIDLYSGDRLASGDSRYAFMETFRLDSSGRIRDTQYQLVPREQVYVERQWNPWSDGDRDNTPTWGNWGDDRFAQSPFPLFQQRPPPPFSRDPYANRQGWDDYERYPRPRRVDPDYFWGRRQTY